uniref:Ig-like domain-containing protein n=1 Tax=Maylandia zebra TaxID=106582 RepID=A0A3P9CS13_9CICH
MAEDIRVDKPQVFTEGMSSGPSSEAASQTVRHKFTFSFDVVGEAPCVVTELENITCSEGETAVLKCVITGEPAPDVTWYHDHICLEATSQRAVRLVANTDNKTSEEGEKYVSIDFDVFADTAKDEKIEFKGKSSDMCSFQFQVTETPPKCIIPLTDVTAAVGTPVILQCLVNGKPNPTAEWYKDGDRITDSRYIIQVKTAGHFNLLITNVTQSDAGEYKCIIQNTAGCIETAALLKFECEIEEAPDVAFKWYKSGTEIRQSEKYRIVSHHTSSSLELLNPVKADSGEYTCKASNQHGTDSCTASHCGKYSCQVQNQAGSQTCSAVLTVKGWLRY